jgi:hypothetical protein
MTTALGKGFHAAGRRDQLAYEVLASATVKPRYAAVDVTDVA